MPWSPVNFGKYRGKGKTLPQIVFDDPDWFFWAVKEDAFKGSLRDEAREIDARARAIRIPNNRAGDLQPVYFFHPRTGKFTHMEITRKRKGFSDSFREDVIDLSVSHRMAHYDKQGCKNLLRSAKRVLFGSASARMTQERCEAFFDDPMNFDCGESNTSRLTKDLNRSGVDTPRLRRWGAFSPDVIKQAQERLVVRRR